MNLGDKADPPAQRGKPYLGMVPGIILILAPCKLHYQAMTLETQIWGFSSLASHLASSLNQKAKFKDIIPMPAHWFLLWQAVVTVLLKQNPYPSQHTFVLPRFQTVDCYASSCTSSHLSSRREECHQLLLQSIWSEITRILSQNR